MTELEKLEGIIAELKSRELTQKGIAKTYGVKNGAVSKIYGEYVQTNGERYSTKTIEEIILEGIMNGETYQEIANKLGTTQQAVSEQARRKFGEKRNGLTDEELVRKYGMQVIKLRSEGNSKLKIKEKLDNIGEDRVKKNWDILELPTINEEREQECRKLIECGFSTKIELSRIIGISYVHIEFFIKKYMPDVKELMTKSKKGRYHPNMRNTPPKEEERREKRAGIIGSIKEVVRETEGDYEAVLMAVNTALSMGILDETDTENLHKYRRAIMGKMMEDELLEKMKRYLEKQKVELNVER